MSLLHAEDPTMDFTIAIDAGGTHTRAALYRGLEKIAETAAGPANPVASGVAQSAAILADVAKRLAGPVGGAVATMACGVSGGGPAWPTRSLGQTAR